MSGEAERVYKNGKELRRGYTTGSCAAAAAKAAARCLLGLGRAETVELLTPGGTRLELPVENAPETLEAVRCGVRKDAGDDADVTDGLVIYAEVRRIEAGYEVEGGTGVGRVTRPGLDQPVGAAAINSVPRRMILESLREAAEQADYHGGLRALISAPGGEEIAQRTFNPRLGIEGGISILGTSGIVEPMSEQALIDTIRAEVRMRIAEGTRALLMAPGNYGEEFIRTRLGIELESCVKCSNFIGEALELAAGSGAESVLLVGHIGKLVKLGSGIVNTHSRYADARMETLAACLLRAGGGAEEARAILSCNTTEEAVERLRESAYGAETLRLLAERVEETMRRQVYGRIEIGAILFSRQSGLCLIGAGAALLMERMGLTLREERALLE